MDWPSLTHAYGSAADLPALLDKLRTGTAAEAGRAVSDIVLRVCHQGAAVEEATAPAVAVLMEIAASSDPHLTERIIRVLLTVSESLGTWARSLRSAAPENTFRYVPRAGWEHEVLRSLRQGSESLGAAAAQWTSPLSARFDELVEAISAAEDRISGSL